MKLIISAILLTSLILNSCKKDNSDDEKPKIISFAANPSVEIGNDLIVTSDISDNKLLKSYKITVANNFGYTADSFEETTRFSYIYVYEIENKNIYTINSLRISVPTNASAGPYLLKLTAVDDKGNESIAKVHYLEITNATDQPTVNITNPTSSSSYNQGDTIFVAGALQDDKAIKEVSFIASNELGNFYTNSFNYDTVVKTNFNIATDGNIKIPVPSFSGDYTLKTNVKDTTGNLKQHTVTFSVN